MLSVAKAAQLPPETKLMVQWRGEFRSDFFQLTAGDIRSALKTGSAR